VVFDVVKGKRLTWSTERDSTKDQAVVFMFILATVGLLTYAVVRPWIDQWKEVGHIVFCYCGMVLIMAQKARERSSYIPVRNTER
jgi:putative Mn2+ efflux pump MntP